jgi:hypothetical protein
LLAARAGIKSTAVLDFEVVGIRLRPETIVQLRAALEGAGVEFTNGDALGVRLRKGAG